MAGTAPLSGGSLPIVADAAPYAERRAAALAALGPHAVLLLPARPELRAGDDAELRYVIDSYLYYLTGYQEPDAVLVLGPAGAAAPFTLFVRPRDPERELWTGSRGGEVAARTGFGADVAHPVADLEARLPALLEGADQLFYRFGSSARLDQLVIRLLAAGRARRPRSGRGLHTITDPGRLLDEPRLHKDAHEIARLRAAADIAVASFRDLRGAIRPGAGEWQLEAELEAGFRRRGASGPAFPTIVAAGVNATVLHYTANAGVLGNDDVVLVDGGARAALYCSDITRCYPAHGRFTGPQLALYRVVWRAHDAAVAAARPGAPVAGVHDAAVRALVEGLVELGLLRGDPELLVGQADTWRRFYPHKTSHWLGLDVHDVGEYTCGGEPRALAPGMVLTVEPGLYIPAETAEAPAGLRGVGIRLEDDVLVTGTGPEVLTAALPLDPESLFD